MLKLATTSFAAGCECELEGLLIFLRGVDAPHLHSWALGGAKLNEVPCRIRFGGLMRKKVPLPSEMKVMKLLLYCTRCSQYLSRIYMRTVGIFGWLDGTILECAVELHMVFSLVMLMERVIKLSKFEFKVT